MKEKIISIKKVIPGLEYMPYTQNNANIISAIYATLDDIYAELENLEQTGATKNASGTSKSAD